MVRSIYVETSVISYLTSWPREDVTIAGHQRTTQEWWATAADQFDLFVSELVVAECSRGDADAARDRLKAIDGLPIVPTSVAAETLAVTLINQRAVPETEPNDALHIALAAAHGVEFLVSWNFRHILNASLRPAIERVCRDAGFDPPVLCTPEELLEVDDEE